MKQMKNANSVIRLWLVLTASSCLGWADNLAARNASGLTDAPSPIRLPFSEAVAEALKLNPGLAAAGHQAKAAQHNASAAAPGPLG